MREELNYLVKNEVFNHGYNKIYICERSNIYLNNMKLITLSIDVVKRYNFFLTGNDADFIVAVVNLMKTYGVEDVYFEVKNGIVNFFDIPQTCQINKDWFLQPEVNMFAIKSLHKIIKAYEFEEKRFIDYLSLYEPKTALQILQYVRYNEMLSICELNNVLYRYIRKLDKEIGFSKMNNFRYISHAVRYLFSLAQIEIDSQSK